VSAFICDSVEAKRLVPDGVEKHEAQLFKAIIKHSYTDKHLMFYDWFYSNFVLFKYHNFLLNFIFSLLF